MDDTSKEDDMLNAPEVRGSGYLEDTQSGMPILTDLCLAMVSDPLGMIRGLGELVTCIYGPAVTYAFPDPLVAAYRNCGASELDKCARWDSAELVQTGRV